MESGQYIVVRVTPNQKAYTWWVVDPNAGGIKLRADGLPIEPEYVYSHRTSSAAVIGSAVQGELPVLTGGSVTPTPPSSLVEISSSLIGDGTIQIGATKIASIDVQLDGGGDFQVGETMLSRVDATLPGNGAAIIAAGVVQQIITTAAGAGAISIDASTHPGPQMLAANFAGTGAIAIGAILKAQVRSTLAGAGTVSVNASLRERISKTFAGTGTLTADVIGHPGKIAITSRLNGAGTLQANVQSGTIFNVAAAVAGNNVTITAQTSVNLTASPKVFGVEFGDVNVYTHSKNISGAVRDQSITIGAQDDVIQGHTLAYRAYYNLTSGDPYTTRNYGGAAARTVDVPNGSVNILATLAGAGALSTGSVSGLYNVNATESLGSVTVTASSTVDLSNARFGIEYADGVTSSYTHSKNAPGGVSSETVTVNPGDDVVSGHTLSYRTYYNLTEQDPYTTRVYGPAGTIAVP